MNKLITLFYVGLIMSASFPAISQVQVGTDIDGEAPGDLFGLSVSLSANGSRLAVGTPSNDENGENSGHVRVFNWEGSDWGQLGPNLYGEIAGDQFGSTVSLSDDGSKLAVGAIGTDGNRGLVRVFQWDGTEWIQLGSDMVGEAVSDQLGISISFSADGNYLAMSTPKNGGNGPISGHARVFHWDGTEWIQVGEDIDGEEAGDQSGWSVSLSDDGSILAIGSRFNNGNGGNSGQVRVFQWDNTEWIQLGSDIDGEATGDQFGWSVSLSADGSRLAAGTPLNNANGAETGHVRVYTWDGIEWIQLGSDIDGEATGDWFGHSVSLSADGNLLVIGATQKDVSEDEIGYTRLYSWDGSEWTQLGVDIEGEAAGDESGYRVALSSNGSRLAISAIYNDGNGEDSGHVRVFGMLPSAAQSIPVVNLRVFPNPARNEVYFRGVNIAQIQMFDYAGRLVFDENQPGQSINISNFVTGVYFLEIVTDEITYSVRVLKQ